MNLYIRWIWYIGQKAEILYSWKIQVYIFFEVGSVWNLPGLFVLVTIKNLTESDAEKPHIQWGTGRLLPACRWTLCRQMLWTVSRPKGTDEDNKLRRGSLDYWTGPIFLGGILNLMQMYGNLRDFPWNCLGWSYNDPWILGHLSEMRRFFPKNRSFWGKIFFHSSKPFFRFIQRGNSALR